MITNEMLLFLERYMKPYHVSTAMVRTLSGSNPILAAQWITQLSLYQHSGQKPKNICVCILAQMKILKKKLRSHFIANEDFEKKFAFTF